MHGEYKQQWERDKRLKYHLHAVSYLKYSLGTLMNEVIFLITMSEQFFFFSNYNSSFKCWHFLMQVSFNSCYDPLILEGIWQYCNHESFFSQVFRYDFSAKSLFFLQDRMFLMFCQGNYCVLAEFPRQIPAGNEIQCQCKANS